MPPLKIELAKSSRGKCALKECGKVIEKGELRVGTGNLMPGAEEYSFKFRHLSCFTKRQLASVSGPEAFEGYPDLCDADKAMVEMLARGELVGKNELIGRISPDAMASPTPTAKKAKKNETKLELATDDAIDSSAPKKRTQKRSRPEADAGVLTTSQQSVHSAPQIVQAWLLNDNTTETDLLFGSALASHSTQVNVTDGDDDLSNASTMSYHGVVV